jgi:parallel beta-helix repeat protein
MSVASTRDAYAQTTPTPTPVPTPAGKTILVDDDRRQFKNAPYSYINNAIFAASAGDTIRVAPGIYREAVAITKSVRIQGAQFGKPVTLRSRLGNFAPGQESIIAFGVNLQLLPVVENAIVTVVKSGAVLDGFTIQGDNTNPYRIGVASKTVLTDFSLLNTRIENVTVGLFAGDPKSSQTREMTNVLIQGNAFLNNQNTTDPGYQGATGQGIRAENATGVSILSNIFSGNQDVAVFLGNPDAEPAEGQEPVQKVFVSDADVSSNLFDASLSPQPSGAGAVLMNATAVTLTKNTVRGGTTVGMELDAQDGLQTTQPSVVSQNDISGVAGSGLIFRNSLLRASVTRNTVVGNASHGIVVSDVTAFISAFNVFSRNKATNNAGAGFLLFYAIGNNLDNNALSGNGVGVFVDRSQDNYFRNNAIRDSAFDGIFVNEFGSGNVFTRNRIQDSLGFDINDASVGDETYGTRNVYRSNKAGRTNPAELGTTKK